MLAAVMMVGGAAAGWGQEMPVVLVDRAESVAAGGEVVFRFTAMIPSLPSYVFRVRADGSGSFEQTKMAGDGSAQAVRRALLISGKTATGIFAEAKAVQESGFDCESKVKGIARTGVKVLEFGGGSCTYNYSENKAVAGLTETFQAMAATFDAGERMAFKHKYDRLGLNDEMMNLVAAVKAGRAIEVRNIAGVLQSLVDDGEVLERVRVRAAELLKMP